MMEELEEVRGEMEATLAALTTAMKRVDIDKVRGGVNF
jgi:hypothetical protein